VSNEFDVVVIGGGPVGLWLACELALAKVKVLVLERRTERVHPIPRIDDPRSNPGGVRPAWDRGALPLTRSSEPRFFLRRLDTLLDFSTLESRFPFTLFLPQATTERLIEERALELGVDISVATLWKRLSRMPTASSYGGRNGETPFGFACSLRRWGRWRSQYRKACLSHRFWSVIRHGIQ